MHARRQLTHPFARPRAPRALRGTLSRTRPTGPATLNAALTLAVAIASMLPPATASAQEAPRPRARDLGIEVGIFTPGTHNAITDVDGVLVGHTTVISGDDIRTGVTAIRPHGGNLYFDRVPAAMYVGNGFGKLLGVTQVRELGELETPILLTCTLCVWKAADAMVEWALGLEGMERVRSINPVVGETNDGGLNDIRNRPITPEHVRAALEGAAGGPVEEGAVGAGTGTAAFGWKGGIGTSSRVLPESLGGYTVGVLVQSNFGGILQIAGAPVGVELGRYSFRNQVEAGRNDDGRNDGTGSSAGAPGPDDAPETAAHEDPDPQARGSIMMIVATDAPLSERNLERVAMRAVMGLSRTGSFAGNGSGDYVISFSSAPGVRRRPGDVVRSIQDLSNDNISAVFQATVEATEEAVYNSMFRAVTVSSRWGTREELPIEETLEVLRRYGVVPR